MQVTTSTPSSKVVQNWQFGFTAVWVAGVGWKGREKHHKVAFFNIFFLKGVSFEGGKKMTDLIFEKYDKIWRLHWTQSAADP